MAVRVKPNQKGGYTYLNVIGIKPAPEEVLAPPPPAKKQRKVNIFYSVNTVIVTIREDFTR